MSYKYLSLFIIILYFTCKCVSDINCVCFIYLFICYNVICVNFDACECVLYSINMM